MNSSPTEDRARWERTADRLQLAVRPYATSTGGNALGSACTIPVVATGVPVAHDTAPGTCCAQVTRKDRPRA